MPGYDCAVSDTLNCDCPPKRLINLTNLRAAWLRRTLGTAVLTHYCNHRADSAKTSAVDIDPTCVRFRPVNIGHGSRGNRRIFCGERRNSNGNGDQEDEHAN